MTLLELKGVGEKRAETLRKNGIHTPLEIVRRYPKRYVHQKLSTLDEVEQDETAYLQGEIKSEASVYFIRTNLSRLTVRVAVEKTLFSVSIFNQHYLKRTLSPGLKVVVYGKIRNHAITAQRITRADGFEEGFLPVYNLEGIKDKTFYNLCMTAHAHLQDHFVDILPSTLREKYRLIGYSTLLKHVHKPANTRVHKQVMRRLKYEELLLYQLKIAYLKNRRKSQTGAEQNYDIDTVRAFIKTLPFELTSAQKRETNAIFKNLKAAAPMHRILQGDTGSGKTVVALICAVAVMSAGRQVALMAPTEILARQHYENIRALVEGTAFKVVYLSQSVENDAAKTIKEKLGAGSIDMVVGTHMLFSKTVVYNDLAFVITDEQHRFGVNQRLSLKKKGKLVDSLYLSATPIPRTLAKTLFGDMDVSILEDRPENRLPTKTTLILSQNENKVFSRVAETLSRGEQVFVVAPNITDSERTLHSVETLYRRYQKHFSSAKTAFLHGMMDKPSQQVILESFKALKTDILIATTLIEVGIDFPNATLMIVYHAERFGYAQLHQLRGRVGRGEKQGQCLLVFEPGEDYRARLSVLETTTDGFKLSAFDLENRGFGDLVGTLQSGYLPFEHADVSTDMAILNTARNDALIMFDDIFKDKKPAYKALRESVLRQVSQPKWFQT